MPLPGQTRLLPVVVVTAALLALPGAGSAGSLGVDSDSPMVAASRSSPHPVERPRPIEVPVPYPIGVPQPYPIGIPTPYPIGVPVPYPIVPPYPIGFPPSYPIAPPLPIGVPPPYPIAPPGGLPIAPPGPDTLPPAAPTLITAPTGLTDSALLEFGGEPGAGFQCSVDDAPFESCSSPFVPDLPDGAHVIRIVQLDLAGNVSAPALVRFELDTVAPEPPILVGEPDVDGGSASIDFGGEDDADFECSLDGDDFEACTSPAVFPGLDRGRHLLLIRQIDVAGNAGPVRKVRFEIRGHGRGHDLPDRLRPRRVALVTTSVTTLIGRTLRVGCEPDRGAIDSCAVTVFARVRGDRGRLPRLPRRHGLAMIAAGRARSDGVVRIRMPRRARLLVNRRGGILVRMRLRARAFDGRTLTAIRRVRLLPRRRLVAATDRLFLSGGAVALPGGRRYLRRIALELAGARRVVCIGHTDGVGSAALNRLLGRARAAAVCRGLRRAGLRAKFRARSRGEAQPRATNRTAHGRALNRRVDLLVRY